MVKICVSPEDAQDDNGCGERNQRNTVADGVANLHLQKKLTLQNKYRVKTNQKSEIFFQI